MISAGKAPEHTIHRPGMAEGEEKKGKKGDEQPSFLALHEWNGA